jgi:hypothetical protein
MKYISRDTLEQILDAYIEASQHKLEIYGEKAESLHALVVG